MDEILHTDLAPGECRELLAAMSQPLLQWYDRSARVLPWRERPTPYRVWVSEIMLQQTRVAAVLPYFERFVTALPDEQALADAPQDQLLKLWEGLGYYNRVKNMQKCAREVVACHGGRLPGDYCALLKLPGIGAYTAGAIASIAFGQRFPAVDGNVLRVMARLISCDSDILQPRVKKAFGELVLSAMPHHRPGDFNQAMMELGATICLPNTLPLCPSCPLGEICRGRALQTHHHLPHKAPKKAKRNEQWTVVVARWQGRILLQRRPESGLLGGMYQYLCLPGHLGAEECQQQLAAQGLCVHTLRPLGAAKHIFTHIVWQMEGYLADLSAPPQEPLYTLEEIEEQLSVPSAFAHYTRQLPTLPLPL